MTDMFAVNTIWLTWANVFALVATASTWVLVIVVKKLFDVHRVVLR